MGTNPLLILSFSKRPFWPKSHLSAYVLSSGAISPATVEERTVIYADVNSRRLFCGNEPTFNIKFQQRPFWPKSHLSAYVLSSGVISPAKSISLLEYRPAY